MSPEPDNIPQLIAQFTAGEDAALASLFTHFKGRLERIVRFRLDHRMAGRVSPADVLQEAYISASKRTEHFREKPDMPFFVWLRLLVHQQLADLHRQHLQAEMRDVRREISLEQQPISPHTSMAMAAQLVGHNTSPSQAFSRVERISSLERALNQMEPIDREVIALRHFEELTNAEVAQVLNIGTAAASKRYVRAIKRMKEVVAGIPGFTQS